jgi:hypothetical protein
MLWLWSRDLNYGRQLFWLNNARSRMKIRLTCLLFFAIKVSAAQVLIVEIIFQGDKKNTKKTLL